MNIISIKDGRIVLFFANDNRRRGNLTNFGLRLICMLYTNQHIANWCMVQIENNQRKANEPEEIIALRKRLIAELVGTFALVFAAAGSDIADSINDHSMGKFAIAAPPGIVVVAMTYSLDKISGAYFNPAISIDSP